jgi:hypothetical protein
MHYAKIKSSPRLQRLLRALSSANYFMDGWLTTMQIIGIAEICAVNSAVSELRRNGYVVESRRSATTKGAWEYKLVQIPGEVAT